MKIIKHISSQYLNLHLRAYAKVLSMQIELMTILNKAWAAFLVLIPWAKRAIDKRFEDTEKKVSIMSDQMTELISKQDVLVTKQDFNAKGIEQCQQSIDQLRELLIDEIRHK